VSNAFDLKTGSLAVGDPTMGFARYTLPLAPGAYRLGPQAFRYVAANSAVELGQPIISLDNPCVFAPDASHVVEFEAWYHRIGNECAYMALTLAERLTEFEAAVGARVGFYWEHEVAGYDREGQYVLDPTGVLQEAEPGTGSGRLVVVL
jgi:hypothetical protein